MSSLPSRRARVAVLAPVLALALAGSATAAHHDERLVVRGTDTVVDGGPCPAGVCTLTLADGAFRGTTGAGAYTGEVKLAVAQAFPNGEGGVCAPVAGRIVLGDGTPDRLVVRLSGSSCQDGAGPVTEASFTGLARFDVVRGHGAYAHARGSGIASFVEGADDREQMTLIGHLTR